MTRSFVATSLALLCTVGCSGPGDGPASTTSQADQASRALDFPQKSRTPTRNQAGTATMQYYGGRVISNAKVYVVWWGNPAGINPVLTAAHGGIADFFAGVTNSNYIDWLNEYNTTIKVQAGSHAGSAGTHQRIGRGNFGGTFTLTAIPAGNVTDSQIQATLDQAIAAGKLPAPDENTIYAVYFPASVTITLPGAGSSCSSFGAYHFAIQETVRHNVYYLVMPDCGTDFPGFTDVSSHELMEATTDAIPTPGSNPDFPQAWNDSGGSEVGDLCQSSSGTVTTAFGSFTVQGIWDELSLGCPVTRAYAHDYNVSFAVNAGTMAISTPTTFTVQTATVAGTAQTLTLSATAPPGVTLSLNPSQVTSGQSATLTVTATHPAAGMQVVVRADGSTGSARQSHTAALLLRVRTHLSDPIDVPVTDVPAN